MLSQIKCRLIHEKKICSHRIGALGFGILPSPRQPQRGPRSCARIGQSKLGKAPERHSAATLIAGQAIKEAPHLPLHQSRSSALSARNRKAFNLVADLASPRCVTRCRWGQALQAAGDV
jgi:hypothetical protein